MFCVCSWVPGSSSALSPGTISPVTKVQLKQEGAFTWCLCVSLAQVQHATVLKREE